MSRPPAQTDATAPANAGQASAGNNKAAPQIGPGRPKDLNKRAAILDAARRMFIPNGFEGTSMDQIAAEAGVSKLTVYSHFGDKDALYITVVKEYCEQSLPTQLFHPSPETPLRERLLTIAKAFFTMISSPEAITGHRVMCSPKLKESHLPAQFWEAGPQRIQNAFADLLVRRQRAGELDVPDPHLAASQFFTLLKGELHAQLVLGCCNPNAPIDVPSHLEASVDMFLSAYGVRAAATASRAAQHRSVPGQA